MPQSLAKNLVHLVFSTKERRPLLEDGIREESHRYACGILKDLESLALAVNSVADHVHVLFNLHRTKAIADLVMQLDRDRSPVAAQTNRPGCRIVSRSPHALILQTCALCPPPREAGISVLFEGAATGDRSRSELVGMDEIEFDERYVWD